MALKMMISALESIWALKSVELILTGFLKEVVSYERKFSDDASYRVLGPINFFKCEHSGL